MDSKSSRWPELLCGLILIITAAGKIFALFNGSSLLVQDHPFLPGSYRHYMYLGLAAELAALVLLAVARFRAFLAVAIGLSVIFVAYHALQVGLQITGPCPCLGGILGAWKPLAGSESLVSFFFACSMGIASFVGLFPASKADNVPMAPQRLSVSVGLSFALWLVFGVSLVLFWSGHTLGGDGGMEAAKALRLAVDSMSWLRVWNDQPPLFSFIGALALRLFGHDLNVLRTAAMLIGTALPVTIAVFCSQIGARWAGVISVCFLWLALPSSWASFMQEGPSYALGIAALLPLLLRGGDRTAIGLSAFIAAASLSIKLTGAFALVVPFVWLWQRSISKALIWGFVAVALMVSFSFAIPGWSWATIAATHLDKSSNESLIYHISPLPYVEAWFVSCLAIFAVANRYVRGGLHSLIPWIAASIVAVGIHFFHHPYFGYYDIHLIAPLAVLGAVGVVELLRMNSNFEIGLREQWALSVGFIVLGSVWGWHRIDGLRSTHQSSNLLAGSTIVKELRHLDDEGHTVFAMEPIWTFSAGMMQTPPELTLVSLKRIWTGQASDTAVIESLRSNSVAGVVVLKNLLKNPEWANFLSSYTPSAQYAGHALFVRKDLNPKPIDLDDERQFLRTLGL